MSPARILAFDVLRKVERGGYASDLLRVEGEGLSVKDAALASEIVFGVLRFQAQLDHLLARYSGRDTSRFDTEVLLAFRIGIYQLCHLDRVPSHAAVNDSVALVKRAHKRSAAGLVNAVLRKVKPSPASWPARDIELSHPEWLLEGWERMFGAQGTRGIATAFLRPPVTYIRVPENRLEEVAGLRISPTGIPGCHCLLNGNPGHFRRQDVSSQSVVPMLGLEPGHTFLDLCAAPGNKTAQALETPVKATACDISFDRLRELRGLDADLVNLDGTARLPFRRTFDRILVDAPCSGTGTIGRNPEIKWRIQPSDVASHHVRQVRLLQCAVENLASGGRLVYATCSLEYEENEQVISEVVDGLPPEFVLENQFRRIPGVDPGDGFYAASIIRASG